jgi:anti-sigma factor RsiW
MAAAIDDVALGTPPSNALAAHLATCAACAAQLERRRLLVRRIDGALADVVRAEPGAGLAERIAARVAAQRPRRRRPVWLAVPAGVALAAGFLIVFSAFGGMRAPVPATSLTAIAAWRSPTSSLLVSRSDVFATPFTFRGVRDVSGRSRS